MKRKLVWEVWENPLLKMGKNDNLDEHLTEYEKQELEEQYGGMKVMYTPFGIIPIKNIEPNEFNRWIAHTDFPITKEMAYKISNVLGVETTQFFSDYRFCIGVAKLFKSADVKKSIQDVLNIVVEKPDLITQKTIDKVSGHKNWAVFVLPNKQIHTVFTNNENDPNFISTVESYREAYNGFGGQLFLSNEYENQNNS